MRDPDVGSPGSADPSRLISFRLNRDEALVVLASMHVYLTHIREHNADDPDKMAHAEYALGTLIWRLEDADAAPQPVGGHSADAVDPS